jgi:hypothetical protein
MARFFMVVIGLNPYIVAYQRKRGGGVNVHPSPLQPAAISRKSPQHHC